VILEKLTVSNMDYQALIQYVIGAPYFWQSIGFITAVGMFIGAIIFDGHMKMVQKAILSTVIYASLLIFMNINRIFGYFSSPEIYVTTHSLASTVTTAIVTLAYSFGMVLGVWILSRKKEKYEANRSS